MTQRKLIRTHKLPPGSNPTLLAESLTDDFNIASISGSGGEVEVQLVHPPELVVLLDASRARFFVVPLLEEDDDDDEDDDEDDPHAIAEDMSHFLARQTGQIQDEDEDDEEDTTPEDDSDEVARRVVKRLLEEGLLELVTPRSQTSVEEYLAHQIAHGRTGDSLCDDLTEVKGVAELYASNEQLAEILVACSRKRVVRTVREDIPPLVARLKSLLNAEDSKAPAKAPLKMPAKASSKASAPAPAATKSTKKAAKKTTPEASPPRKRKS